MQMIASRPRILVIDREYFVALEAERILTEGLACAVEIAMPRTFRALIEGAPFDVVVIDAALMTAERQEILQVHHQAGVGIVFTTLSSSDHNRFSGFAPSRAVRKPFVDQELLEAVRNALAQSLRTA